MPMTSRFLRTLLIVIVSIVGIGISATHASLVGALDETEWRHAESTHFSVYSQLSERQTRKLVENLELLRAVLGQIGGLDLTSPVPSVIFVFDAHREFVPFIPARFAGRGDNLAAYFYAARYQSFIAMVGKEMGDATAIAYHEYIHELVRHNLPQLPLWLNEGLAEYFSTFEVVGDYAKIGLPITHHVRWLRGNELIPAGRLFSIGTTDPEYNEGSRRGVFYAQSWAMTHLLAHLDGGNLLRDSRILARLGQGEAIESIISGGGEALERRLTEYIRGTGYAQYRRIDIEPPEDAAVTMSRPSRSELLAVLGDLKLHLDRDEVDAPRELFEAALAAPGKTPRDEARARLGMGMLAERRDRRAIALEHYRAAYALRDDDPRVVFHYGTALISGGTSEEAEEAIPVLEAAVRSMPRFRDAWRALITAYGQSPASTSDEAVAALEQAILVLPRRARMLTRSLAEVRLARNEVDAIRELVETWRPRSPDLAAELELKIRRYEERQGREQLFAAFDLIRDKDYDDAETELARLAEVALSDADEASRVEALENLRALRSRGEEANRDDTERVLASIHTDERVPLGVVPMSSVNVVGGTESYLEADRLTVEQEATRDRAKALVDEGELDEALRLFVAVRDELPGEHPWRDYFVDQVERIESNLVYSRYVDAYNTAVRAYNAGDFKGAVAALEDEFEAQPSHPLSDQARALLARARARLE
ncbi:MAG: hypothetical protein AAGD38_07850 [Acidobacteriota bacterium]